MPDPADSTPGHFVRRIYKLSMATANDDHEAAVEIQEELRRLGVDIRFRYWGDEEDGGPCASPKAIVAEELPDVYKQVRITWLICLAKYILHGDLQNAAMAQRELLGWGVDVSFRNQQKRGCVFGSMVAAGPQGTARKS